MKAVTKYPNKFLPFWKNKRNKKYKFLYVALNIYLAIGVVSLLISIFYLLLNFEQADKIIVYCVPGFVIFLSAAILYIIGYQNMISNEKIKRHRIINTRNENAE